MQNIDTIWGPIAAVLVAAAAYGISFFKDLHRTKGQHRADFLGLWKGADKMDDLSLEVAVRHLCGTYLPASLIRRICRVDHCADGILEMAQLWPLWRYDPRNRRVEWKEPNYASHGKLVFFRWWYVAGYFFFAIGAICFLMLAISADSKSLLAWASGLNALMFPVIAFGSLGKSEAFKLASKVGAQWLERLNDADAVLPPLASSTTPDASTSPQ